MSLHNARANIAMTVRAGLHTGSGIMCHKIPVGDVFALDFTPRTGKRKMYTLIDCTNMRPIATHISYRALSALAFIQYANVDTVVMPCNENRPFAQFTAQELDKLADDAGTGASPVTGKFGNGFKTQGYTYGDIIARTRLVIEAAPQLRLPFTAEHLEQQAEKIKQSDERPWCIDADGIAKPAKRWASDPQRNRSRIDARPEVRQFHPQGNGPAPTPGKTNGHDKTPQASQAAPVDDPAEPVMTRKAKGITRAEFLAEGWTDELLIREGYMRAPKERKPPKPAPASAPHVMTDKAQGIPYADFIAAGWTDALLIQHGYMTG